jgi:hypothetical protein
LAFGYCGLLFQLTGFYKIRYNCPRDEKNTRFFCACGRVLRAGVFSGACGEARNSVIAARDIVVGRGFRAPNGGQAGFAKERGAAGFAALGGPRAFRARRLGGSGRSGGAGGGIALGGGPARAFACEVRGPGGCAGGSGGCAAGPGGG